MKQWLSHLRGAVLATIVLSFLCCGVYPLAVYSLGQALFREQANGSLITDSAGTVRGSRLIGQTFTGERYFHPRPSAAGQGFDAANSSGSNLGPTSRKLHDAVRDRIDAYWRVNGLKSDQPVPADAVTASGSGLDPHISLQNAAMQLPRVARARNLAESELQAIVQRCTDGPSGSLGATGVNVLRLNLELDARRPKL